MDFEALRAYCILKVDSAECFPFGAQHSVFKVQNKIFAIIAQTVERTSISLKCDPDLSIALRLEYAEIEPGYHLNKKHWNTIRTSANVSEKLLTWLIDLSYELVLSASIGKNRKTAQKAQKNVYKTGDL